MKKWPTQKALSHDFNLCESFVLNWVVIAVPTRRLYEIVSFSILLHFSLIEKLDLDVSVMKKYLHAVGVLLHGPVP